jgi:hypothetical protein
MNIEIKKKTAQNTAPMLLIRISMAFGVNFVLKGRRLDPVCHWLSFCVVFISLSRVTTK